MARSQRFGSRKTKFSCPVSPHIAWEWDLIFKDCPVAPSERDMEECRTCPLRGHLVDNMRKEKEKEKFRPRRDGADRNKRRAGKPTDKVPDKTVPDKGKAYVG